jgi:fatty-acyl-CoA synthase
MEGQGVMTADEVHRGGTLGSLIVRACQRNASASAVVGPDLRLTYAQLAARIAGMVDAFHAAGLKRQEGVALLALNSTDVLVATAATMVAGLRLTALSPLGSASDHLYCVNDAEISAFVFQPIFAARARELQASAKHLRHLFALGPVDGATDLCKAAEAGTGYPVDEGKAEDVAMVFYTGGTTGKPKGVVHTHASAMAALHMAASEWEWPQDMRVLAATPVSHAAGILAYPTFLRGGEFHLLPSFSPEAFYEYVARERIGLTFLVPTMIYRLLDQPPPKGLDLSCLETVLYGAAPMSVERMVEALKQFGPIFMQLFGQTEAPTCISYLARRQHDPAHPDRLASAGQPHAAVDVALLDDLGNKVADGSLGEICVRGPFVMQGYWRRDEETREAFKFGWLHTGDIGRFDEDGCLHIVDRKKDMIISGGFNVYPREVEDALATAAGVRACAVVGEKDPKWGEAVVAVVVPATTPPPEADSLISHVRELKGAIMAPKKIVFTDTLPLTPIGKIDKKALRAMLSGEGRVNG